MRLARRVLRVGWPVLLFAAIYLGVARFGFSPTDEGFVEAFAHRVLRGEVPHRDFITPRPAGTAYVHALEQLLPLHGVMLGRAIALAQIIGYTLVLATLVIRRSPWRWSGGEVLLASLAVLLNVGVMPLMVWPTIDGILLVAVAALLLRSGIATGGGWRIALAFLLFGAATLMKQSFWPAPIFALVWLVGASLRSNLGDRLRIAVPAMLVLPVLYVVGIGLAGGLDEMATQFSSARPAFGVELITGVADPLATVAATLIVGLAPLARTAIGAPVAVRLAPSLIVAVAIGGVVAVFGIATRDGWAEMLVWPLAANVAVRSIRDRRIDWVGLVLLGTAWMVSLSWGLSVPNLVSGSLVVYLVHRTAGDAPPEPGRRGFASLPVAALVLAVAVVPTFVLDRLEHVYRDRPAASLTTELTSVHPYFSGVLTNPVTAAYLEQLVSCVDAYPAERVAVVPDAPIIYPALDLPNPLPMDWPIPLEVVGSEDRYLAAVRALDERGDYLVLIGPIGAHLLAGEDELAPADSPWRDPGFGRRVRDALSGQEVACGTFTGVWAP